MRRDLEEIFAQNLPSVGPGHIWCYDFAAGRLVDGSAFRVLTADDVDSPR